jgi:hypothetical protein
MAAMRSGRKSVAKLEEMLDRVRSGRLFREERFGATPPGLHRLNDIAFSSDGEPTTCPQFPEIVEAVAGVRRRRGLGG